MTTPTHIAYFILALTLVLVGALHLGAPLLALLFSYFALSKFLLLTPIEADSNVIDRRTVVRR